MKLYRPIIEDKLELCNADGELVKEIPFRINVNESYKKLTAKWGQLSAQVNTDDIERTMTIVKDLCLMAFGESVVQEALEFFGDEYFCLSSLLNCYTEKVYPMMIRLRAENIEQMRKQNRYAETNN